MQLLREEITLKSQEKKGNSLSYYCVIAIYGHLCGLCTAKSDTVSLYIMTTDFSLSLFPLFFMCDKKTNLSFSPSDNVVIYSEKDEFDKLKVPPQKTVKR